MRQVGFNSSFFNVSTICMQSDLVSSFVDFVPRTVKSKQQKLLVELRAASRLTTLTE